MSIDWTGSAPATEPIVPPDTRLGAVTLHVRERAAALAIWRDVVGLDLLGEDGETIRLGAGGRELVRLVADATHPVRRGHAGLYHVAIHVPARPDLAAFLARAVRARVKVSPTDHLVSEAIYLWDADGNGIEITFETPWRGSFSMDDTGAYARTSDGKPHSGLEPIDVDDLMGELPGASDQARLPAGTRIGHVHVHVGDLGTAMDFYRDAVGFGGQLLSAKFGMGDVTMGYMPHILAFNVWQGPDVVQPPAGTAGLDHFTILVPHRAALAAMRERLAGHISSATDDDSDFSGADPWGNRFRVSVA